MSDKIKLTVRLTPKQHTHLKKQAELCGMKMEPLMRKLIMGKAVEARPPDVYYKILKEMNAIGCNVNQIARIANAERHIKSSDINRVAKMVDELTGVVREWHP